MFFPVISPLSVAASFIPCSPIEAELDLKGKVVALSNSLSLNYTSIKKLK